MKSWLTPPHGGRVRKAIGWLLLLLSAGRFFGWGILPTQTFASSECIGALTLCAGVLLLATGPYRLKWFGRTATVLAVGCLATVLASLATSLSALVYAWAIACLSAEALSRRHDC